jgi:hypothetical protein
MRRHPRGRLLFASAVLVAAACTEPQGDPLRAFDGTYALQSINGQPLPMVQQSASTIRVMLVADTIVSDGRGHYTRQDVAEIDSLTVSHQQTRSSFDSGQYSMRGDTIEFPSPCPLDAPCVAQNTCPMGAQCLALKACPVDALCLPLMPFGVLEPAGYLMLFNGVGSSYAWRYKRVR